MIRIGLIVLLLFLGAWLIQAPTSAPPPVASAKESLVYIYTGSTGYGDTF